MTRLEIDAGSGPGMTKLEKDAGSGPGMTKRRHCGPRKPRHCGPRAAIFHVPGMTAAAKYRRRSLRGNIRFYWQETAANNKRSRDRLLLLDVVALVLATAAAGALADDPGDCRQIG